MMLNIPHHIAPKHPGVGEVISNNPHRKVKLSPPCYFCFNPRWLYRINFQKGCQGSGNLWDTVFCPFIMHPVSYFQPCNPIPGSQESHSEPTDAGSRDRLGKNSTVNTDTKTNVHLSIEAYSYLFPGKRLNSNI